MAKMMKYSITAKSRDTKTFGSRGELARSSGTKMTKVRNGSGPSTARVSGEARMKYNQGTRSRSMKPFQYYTGNIDSTNARGRAPNLTTAPRFGKWSKMGRSDRPMKLG